MLSVTKSGSVHLYLIAIYRGGTFRADVPAIQFSEQNQEIKVNRLNSQKNKLNLASVPPQ